MKISMVIRAYNEAAHLPKLLHGLDHQTRQPDQVIVVDSGSTDDTVQIAKAWGVHDIVHIPKEEFTFGRSLNLGVEAATGDVVVIPSAHVFPVYDTWVEKLVAPFADDEVAVAYGRQVWDERTRYSERRIMQRWFPPTSIARQSDPFSNNANSAIRRTRWEEHRYDESLTGLEDLAFAKQMLADGWAVSYVAEAPVVHVHEETWSSIRNRYRREAIAHKRIFDEQNISLGESLSLFFRNVLSDYGHAALEGELFRRFVEIPWFRSAQFLGSYEGFQQEGPITRALKERFYYPDAPTRPRSTDSPPGSVIDYRGT